MEQINDISEELLNEIERLAGLFLSPKEIAFIINIDFEFFNRNLKKPESEIYKRYNLGKIKTKIEIHENVIKLAKHGSPQAQDMIKNFNKNQNIAENK